MTTDETLNELLVRLFKDIMEIEGKCLVTEEFKDLSYNDFHVIEAIGVNEPKTMTTVAKLMGVTTGTLTKAMDGLTRKGYVIRERSTQDKRVVWVYLTDTGRVSSRDDRSDQKPAYRAGDADPDLCAGETCRLFSPCIQG